MMHKIKRRGQWTKGWIKNNSSKPKATFWQKKKVHQHISVE
jgi:hypothetical protein